MHYVIHYREIGIKGDNRALFERRLMDNVRRALGPGRVLLEREYGRILLDAGAAEPERVETWLARLPGIAHFAPVTRLSKDLAAVSDEAVRLSRGTSARTFRIDTRRSDKTFPMTSVEVNRQIGAAVAAATGLGVDLERAEHTVTIEITRHEALVYARRLPGVGGLPVGVSGRAVALLSGGIDSPVAAFKVMRRGTEIVLLHFHNYTRHQEQVRDKLLDLGRVLARHQLGARLYLVPFEEAQMAIVGAVQAESRMIAYRRAMLRIGEAVLEREGARAFVTGDSIGQVASQTLENLEAIWGAARHPVFAPLIGEDKDDIVAFARRLGTYEISIRPYEDCCSFLVARHPTTRVRLLALEQEEARIPLDELGKRALAAAEVLELGAS